jgi:putative ABC transport system substrate-binding protein
LGIQLVHAEHSPTDLKATFANIVRQRPDALLIALAPEVYMQRQQIADFALKARLPAIYPWAEMVQSGGLMSYGWNIEYLYRQTAGYVDKILKGAKPGDLPVEQPAVYELVINLKTARAIGITIPPLILIRADRVIE